MTAKITAAMIVCVFATLPFLFSCDEPTEPGPTYDSLTVLKPVAGESFKAGATVTIEWGYPKDWELQYNQVMISASISASHIPNWKTVTPDGVNHPRNTFQWTIPAGVTGDSCRIKVAEYNNNGKTGYTGYFKVTE